MHSWPITVFAPMLTSPSCTRILQPCPIHAQRPIRSVASRPISSFTPRADEADAFGLQPPAVAQLQVAASAQQQARVVGVSMPCARMKRSSASGPPCSGGGGGRSAPRLVRSGGIGGIDEGLHRERAIARRIVRGAGRRQVPLR